MAKKKATGPAKAPAAKRPAAAAKRPAAAAKNPAARPTMAELRREELTAEQLREKLGRLRDAAEALEAAIVRLETHPRVGKSAGHGKPKTITVDGAKKFEAGMKYLAAYAANVAKAASPEF